MSSDYKRFRGLSDGLARNLDTLIEHKAMSVDADEKPTISARVKRGDGSVYEVRVTQISPPSNMDDAVELAMEERQRAILSESSAKRAAEKEAKKKPAPDLKVAGKKK